MDRLRIRVFVDGASLTGFVVQYETEVAGRFIPVVRYDAQHGRPHRDAIDRRGRVTKTWMPEGTGLRAAFDLGRRDLLANWRIYRERFLRDES